MTTATMTIDPTTTVDWANGLFGAAAEQINATKVITGTGPWTITVPNTITQGELDAYVSAFNTSATAAVNYAALMAKATAAIAANNTFLGLATPTNAQILAQTKLLTREATTLIKFSTGALADQTGT